MDDHKIVDTLERLGRGLSQGDYKAAAACWELPALVVSDQGSVTAERRWEIEDYFENAAKQYHAQGVVETRPDIERVEPMSEKVAVVHVRWPGYDAQGCERMAERSHYVMAEGADGQARIRFASPRTK